MVLKLCAYKFKHILFKIKCVFMFFNKLHILFYKFALLWYLGNIVYPF